MIGLKAEKLLVNLQSFPAAGWITAGALLIEPAQVEIRSGEARRVLKGA
jgi:hypothetical protein